ncbi:MAG: hypothetical protein SPG03_04720 [Veillonella caviae]|uniref:hypothetical protein n=1 Tax=Veillonella caviae TaxID=248316 RepID=UPI002A90A4E4|nr:hypothetical protein [Veillonella caviae]MDY5481672.1 hypothetical protein [Veillonella caviae]
MKLLKKTAYNIVQQDGDTITVNHQLSTTVMPKEHKRIVVIVYGKPPDSPGVQWKL